ncbi:hypothetical protein PAXINDRAFT_16794 [Paxillus involutus ATCC 200175]|uniref:Uncharacterized protein n=1 Tax=Paxillus involutus ATCC 200175 TaxID=664439 RepID=A0A0C9THF7_PAXIN|nr:hypothetical protein PAXINDRAFT_16794 [Paxillus involutus ATCC 200175]
MLYAEVVPLQGEKRKREFRECAEGAGDLDGKGATWSLRRQTVGRLKTVVSSVLQASPANRTSPPHSSSFA